MKRCGLPSIRKSGCKLSAGSRHGAGNWKGMDMITTLNCERALPNQSRLPFICIHLQWFLKKRRHFLNLLTSDPIVVTQEMLLFVVSHKFGADICVHPRSPPVAFHEDNRRIARLVYSQLHCDCIIWLSHVWFARQGRYLVFVQSITRCAACCHHHCY